MKISEIERLINRHIVSLGGCTYGQFEAARAIHRALKKEQSAPCRGCGDCRLRGGAK